MRKVILAIDRNELFFPSGLTYENNSSWMHPIFHKHCSSLRYYQPLSELTLQCSSSSKWTFPPYPGKNACASSPPCPSNATSQLRMSSPLCPSNGSSHLGVSGSRSEWSRTPNTISMSCVPLSVVPTCSNSSGITSLHSWKVVESIQYDNSGCQQ